MKKIFKFGGSSVGTPERINGVIEIIKTSQNAYELVGVVFSAFGGVTDQLIKISNMAANADESYKQELSSLESRHFDAAKELVAVQHQSTVLANIKIMINELEEILHGVFLVKELSNKILDFVMSFGERLSCYIICESLKSRNINAEFLDARIIVKTDRDFGNAKLDIEKTYENISNHFEIHKSLQIITGFLGSTENDETTTLGRGGSDYTAAFFGAALHVDEIEIWSDVDGILTADPRKVPQAFSIESMTYEEAMEMSHFGAKVIYPPSMQPASSRKIPIRMKNTFRPEYEGTIIGKASKTKYSVRGISSIDDISLLTIQGSGLIGVVGISARLFGALAREKINVILISQASSEHSICIAVSPKVALKAQKTIDEEFALEILAKQVDKVSVESGLSIIAIVGENMKHTPGIAGKMFQALGEQLVNVAAIAQGSSEINISAVVQKKDEARALSALHNTFFNTNN